MFNDTPIYEYPHAERIIVVGDIHGDLKRFKNILLDANIINKNIEWIAKPQNTIVIQLGDQIDSTDRLPGIKKWEVLQDIEMLKFTDFLDNISIPKGGRVISLIGNHELMNTVGNFSYVSPNSLITSESRLNKFKPKGDLSYLLSKRPIIIKVGDFLFCHAGLKKIHTDILEKHNKHVSYLNTIWRDYILTGKILYEDKELFDKLILDQDGILWNRQLDEIECTKNLLYDLGCMYMFIGHNTVNNIMCYGNIAWYVDSGISRAYGNTSYEYIDIKNFSINIKKISDT